MNALLGFRPTVSPHIAGLLLPAFALVLLIAGAASAEVTAVLRSEGPASGHRDLRIRRAESMIWDPDGNYEQREGRADATPIRQVGLLRFNLRSIPTGARVNWVRLALTLTESGDQPLYAQRCWRRWLAGEATYHQYRQGEAWTDPGARSDLDRDPTLLAAFTGDGTQVSELVAAGVAAVQDWVRDPESNGGFLLVTPPFAKGAMVWRSSEHGEGEQRPRLVVNYNDNVTKVFQNGRDGYSGTTDTVIASGPSPEVINWDSGGLVVRGAPDTSNVLLAFDVTAIPPWATVRTARLRLDAQGGLDRSHLVYPLLKPWIEKLATWRTTDGTTRWTEPGASAPGVDYEEDVVARIDVDARGLTTTELTGSGRLVVQRWVERPEANHGLVIHHTPEMPVLTLTGSTAADVNQRPTLLVTYLEGQLALSVPAVVPTQAPATFTVLRQRLGSGVPVSTGAPALPVTLTSSSASGRFALSQDGPWSATLVVTLPAQSAASAPVFYSDVTVGTPLLTAAAGPAWQDAVRNLAVSDTAAVVSPAEQNVTVGALVHLDGAGSTVSAGLVLTAYAWHQLEGPTGVPTSASSQLSFEAEAPGRYAFALSVQDSSGFVSPPAVAYVHVAGTVYEPPSEIGCASAGSPPGAAFAALALLALGRVTSRRRRPGRRSTRAPGTGRAS